MTDKSNTGRIAALISKLIGALVSGGLAWGFWQLGTGDWALMRLYAAGFAVAAGVAGVQGIWMLGAALWSLMRINRFKAQGAALKTDRLVQRSDLKKRGLIK